ncbi:hypothetical protein PS2_027877 [Malus domestica]
MFRDFFPHFLRDGWTGRERAESMLCVCVFCVNLKLLLSSFLKQASSLISQAPGSILLRVLGFHYVSFQAFSRSGKDFRFECKIFPQSRRLLFDVNQGAVSHFVLILEVIHRCSVKILGLLFAGFDALCTQGTLPLRLSSMKKYVFGLGSVQCSHKLGLSLELVSL